MPAENESVTKRDEIVQKLRRRILTGEYPRGSRLRQDEIAADFAVSITPVREALRLLEAEGLIVSEPFKGVRVAGIDADRLVGIYVVRRLVESFAIRRAVPRLSRLDLAELERVMSKMEVAGAGDQNIDSRALNRAFHFGLYDRIGLPEVTRQIAGLWDAFPWDLMLSDSDRLAESCAQHRIIFDAAVAGDGELAATAMEKHIASGLEAIRLQQTGSQGVDPFSEFLAVDSPQSIGRA